MKNTGICPKCGGQEILTVPGGDGSRYHDNVISAGWMKISSVEVCRCVCCGCGFSEEWVDPRHIPELKKKYQ